MSRMVIEGVFDLLGGWDRAEDKQAPLPGGATETPV